MNATRDAAGFEARLVNGPLGDPVVFLDSRLSRRAVLFDLGDIAALDRRALLRVTHAFVSHAHVDHFCGFDRLLRQRLDHAAPLHLVGPAGFIAQVEAKLRAYTWNLLDETSPDFSVTVAEHTGVSPSMRACFPARRRFARVDRAPQRLAPGLVLDDPAFTVRAAILDHGTPCLAVALAERDTIHVVPAELERRGLVAGPWLNVAKQALRDCAPADTPVGLDGGRSIWLGDLSGVMTVRRGRTIAYVVDAADHAENRAAITDLARDADQLFIETAFADEDADLARRKRHLTAGAAGRIARAAGVGTVTGLHVSARYADRPDHLARQLDAGFSADGRSTRPATASAA